MPRGAECPFKAPIKAFSDFLLNMFQVFAPGILIGLKLTDFNGFGHQTRKTEEFGVKCIRCEFVEQFMPPARHEGRRGIG